jgi:two-component system, chemotaxis family, chemotaxis protein CheY
MGENREGGLQPKGLILVVDDDADVREALRDALEDEGYVTALAGDGEAALTYLRSSRLPALILLDWLMPGMEPAELHTALKADPRLSPIPVVLLTADIRSRSRAKELGVSDYLDKPVELERLLAVVARYAG